MHAVMHADLIERLRQAAMAAREQAYAPYSNFKVGAALLDEQGRIHVGCNVENAAYPQGVCAEAGALSALVLAGGRSVQAVLVVADTGAGAGASAGTLASPSAVTPCGGCRQKLREFAADEVPVLSADMGGRLDHYTLGQLLPASFGPQHLAHATSLLQGRGRP